MQSGEMRKEARPARRVRRPHPEEVAVRGPLPAPPIVEDDGSTAATAVRVALLAVLAFLPVIACGWVNWDDDKNFLQNPFFRGLGWDQIAWAWRTSLLGVYQPLGWMMLELEYVLWGMDPRGYHVVGLAFQAAIAAAFFVVTQELLRRARPEMAAANPVGLRRSAALAAALYAIHPLRTEAVAWLSCQTYLASYLLILLTTFAYLKAQQPGRTPRGRRARMGLALGLFTLALLFKVVAVTLPAVLLILDVYPLRRLGAGPGLDAWFGPRARRVWLEKAPFFALSLVFCVIAFRTRQVFHVGLGERVATASYAYWFYPWKTLAPFGLAVMYLPEQAVDPTGPLYVACALALVATTTAAVVLRRRLPGLATAWIVYMITLLPNSGLFAIVSSIAADRYCYVPTMGFFVVLGGAFLGLSTRLRSAGEPLAPLRALLPIGAAALILGLVTLSWFQSSTWYNSEMLWTNALEHGGEESVIVHNNLAEALGEQGRIAEALPHYQKAVSLRPDLAKGHANLGLALGQLGRPAEAIPEFREALRLNPVLLPAHRNLAQALMERGDLDAAEAHLREALRLEPRYPEAHYTLGHVLMARGRRDEALAQYAEAVRLRPGYAAAERSLKAARSAGAKAG